MHSVTGRPGIGPDHGALSGDHLERPQRAGILGNVGVDQIGKGHRHRGLHVGMRGIDEAGRLRIGVRQIDLDIAALLGDLCRDPDVAAAMAVIVEKRLAVKHAVLPGRDHRAGLLLGRIEDGLHRGLDHLARRIRANSRDSRRSPRCAAPTIAARSPRNSRGIADVQRQQVEQIVAQPAGFVEFDRRNAQAFLIDFGGRRDCRRHAWRRRCRSGARARWSRAAAARRRRPARTRSGRADGCRHDRDR